KFDLAAVGSEFVSLVGETLRVARIGRVAGPAFGIPSQRRRRAIIFGNVDDIISLALELLPGNTLRQVGDFEEFARPIDLGISFSILFLPPQTLRKQRKDPVVRLRL